MKIKDILKNKVLWIENLGDEYYWEYRLIVQIDKNKIVLLEYDDSWSGYIEFNIESVDKEFISSFFETYEEKDRKIRLNFDTTTILENEIDFEYNKESLEEKVIILDLKDIEQYIEYKE